MKRTQPLRRTPLRRVSKKRSAQLREYSKKRKAFLEAHPFCQVWLGRNGYSELGHGFFSNRDGKPMSDLSLDAMRAPRATDIHHKNKRHGARLNDETHWLAVCREEHEWIHRNPSEARERGWLI